MSSPTQFPDLGCQSKTQAIRPRVARSNTGVGLAQVVRKRGAWTFRKEWIFSVHRFFLKTVLSRSIPSHWSRSRMLDRCHDVCGGTTAGLWADLAGFGGGQRRPCPPPSCSAGTLEVGLFSPCTCGSICKRSPCTDSCRITRHGSLGKATRDEAALLRHASVRIAWAPRHRASCVLGIVCSIVYVKGPKASGGACWLTCEAVRDARRRGYRLAGNNDEGAAAEAHAQRDRPLESSSSACGACGGARRSKGEFERHSDYPRY